MGKKSVSAHPGLILEGTLGTRMGPGGGLVHIFGELVHIFGELVNVFGKLVHIFAGKLVSRTSKQVSRNLGPLWQPGVYNTNL